MKSLFRSIEMRKREIHIKECLSNQLSLSIEEVVTEYESEGSVKASDSANSLCTAVEAIFVHGLKETLADKFTKVMADHDAVPQPDFWSLVLVFSHRDIIEQIQKMSQITTDIGRSRSWIRLVLNELLLLSYVESIANQNSALAPYYKKTAFLRDSAALANLILEVKKISSIGFDFPTNSCLLNYWSNAPLLMAGLWTPPMKPGPVPEGTDVAGGMVGEDVSAGMEAADDGGQATTMIPSLGDVLYDDDEVLKIILGTPIEDSVLESAFSGNQDLVEEARQVQDDVSGTTPSGEDPPNAVKDGRPIDGISEDKAPTQSKEKEAAPTQESAEAATKVVEIPESYDSLLKGYNPLSLPNINDGYEDLINRFDNNSTATARKGSLRESPDDISKDFEIIPPSQKDSINLPEFRIMVAHLSKLIQENGLISQNFMCKSCEQLIGLNFGKARICALTGTYYCDKCFEPVEHVLPARILHNWDFSKYLISGDAASFLNDIKNHPLLDVRIVNPLLYVIVPEMTQLQKLRLRLNLLRMYLYTCRVPVIEALKKQIWPREYLYEHVHLYSISDLLEIPSSNLIHLLKEVINFCENHIMKCTLCSQKGFICELCKKPEIIYPFHLDTTFRCSKCSTVLHHECRRKVADCPKCNRIKKRMTAES